MGAGILPTCIYKNKLYFLFGKERKEDDTPGWSDFGGGTDNNESLMKTAIREAGEELTGFLGSDADISKMLTHHFDIDYKNEGYPMYRMHIFPLAYDPALPFYYNNNQRFIQTHLDPSIIKDTMIFEKAEIRWICIDELPGMKKQFRSYFQNTVETILRKKQDIYQFIRKHQKGSKTRKHRK